MQHDNDDEYKYNIASESVIDDDPNWRLQCNLLMAIANLITTTYHKLPFNNNRDVLAWSVQKWKSYEDKWYIVSKLASY